MIQQLEVNGMKPDQIEILLADEWIACVKLTEHFEMEDELHNEQWFAAEETSILARRLALFLPRSMISPSAGGTK